MSRGGIRLLRRPSPDARVGTLFMCGRHFDGQRTGLARFGEGGPDVSGGGSRAGCPAGFRALGLSMSGTVHASFVLDALEQAIYARKPAKGSGLVHHSDSVQYVSIKYSWRPAEAGIDPSVSSVGDSYDNALAETINGLYRAEAIHRRGPWRSFEAVEFFREGLGVPIPNRIDKADVSCYL